MNFLVINKHKKYKNKTPWMDVYHCALDVYLDPIH